LTGLNSLTLTDGAQLASGRAVLGASPKSAANRVLMAGAGTTWTIATNLAIGGNGSSNQFTVTQGARVTARDVQLAAAELVGTAIGTSRANLLTVSDSNTVISIGSNVWVGYRGSLNRVEIHDGGTLQSSVAMLGVLDPSSSNSVLVSGPGALWFNRSNLVIGGSGTRNELIVERGGRVVSGPAVLGAGGVLEGEGSMCVNRASGDRVRVTDPGSVWECQGALLMGEFGIGNWLTISNGGSVVASDLHLGMTDGIVLGSRCPPFNDFNRLQIDGGCLLVTNASGTARLRVRYGTLRLRSGLVAADFLDATNSEPGRLELFGGTLRLRHAQWQSTTPVEVGDGLHTARLEIPDGSAFFAGGLTIRPHGILSGHAAIQTTVTNHGIIEPGNRDNGLMSFNGPFVQGPSGVLAFSIGGPANLGDYTKMSVTPTASFDGSLRVSLRNGFVPTSNDWYLVVTCPAASGAFTNAPDRGRLLTSDRLGSFLVLYTNNAVVLTDYQSTDLDGDGLEDAWATNYFGHTPLSPAEKAADDDGDGANNGDEFLAGTDPHAAASVLRATLTYTNSAATLSFPCVEGRTYRVLVSADLTVWREVPSPTFAWPEPGRCEWTDDGQDTGGRGADWRFYRLEVE
jgi:T5SS/PEP-CTERM-associated repeat protein